MYLERVHFPLECINYQPEVVLKSRESSTIDGKRLDGRQGMIIFRSIRTRSIAEGGAISNWLVVSTHLKNISQNGNLPQVGVKIKNIWNHQVANL